MQIFNYFFRYPNLQRFCIVAIFFLLSVSAAYSQTTRYVTPTGAGTMDGSSWANASNSLQATLDVAGTGDSIWVAAGTYYPTESPAPSLTDPRNYSFHLNKNVHLYGGFTGSETALSQRNWLVNPSILSGDIGTPNVKSDNCFHVFITKGLSAATLIDGFSIIKGNANEAGSVTYSGGSFWKGNGGGMYNISSSPTLSNVTFSGNSAISFGGMCNTTSSSPILSNVTFSGNSALYGGGMCNTTSSSPILSNVTFSGNSATYGGGMYNTSSSPILSNVTFSGNSAAMFGGGMYNVSSSSPILSNVTFSGNSANSGGGMYNDSSSPTLSNTVFYANTINWFGAAIYGDNISLASSHNASDVLGGGLAARPGFVQLYADPFINRADPDGADNIHRTADDGLRLVYGSPSINTGNNTGVTATDITGAARIQDGTVDIGAYEGGVCPMITTLYVDAGIAVSRGGQSWAAAFKTLDEALAIAHCCTNIDTIKVAAGTYKPTKKPYNGCTEMTTADPRDLTFHLPDGLVLLGGYNAATGLRTLPSSGGAGAILSGDLNGDDAITGSGNAITITNNTENAYHVLLAVGNTGVIIDGFTIIGGNANGSSTITVNSTTIEQTNGGGIATLNGTNTLTNSTLYHNTGLYGGAIRTINGTNTFSNNSMYENKAGSSGACIQMSSGTNTLTNNTIYNNFAPAVGGAIYMTSGNNTLTNNIFTNNKSYYSGAIDSNYGTNTMTNNIFSNNICTAYGGAISINNGTNTLTNNIFSDNRGIGAGAMYIENGANTLINNTFLRNTATSNFGGAIYTANGTHTFINNIFWDNKKGTNPSVQGADYFADGTNGNTFKYNLLQLAASNYPVSNSGHYAIGAAASGNIFAQDPLFVNATDIDGTDNIHRTADDGLRLKVGSPCINTGNNTALPSSGGAGGGFDITGAARIQNATVDMGAYEGGVCPTVSTLYVDANIATSGNGTTFAQAYKTLDEALAIAHCCSNIDTIKVATGTYKPTKKPYNGCTEMTTADPRDLTFHLPDGLVLLGGYDAATGLRTLSSSGGAGGGAILSGDFNGNDVVAGSGSTLSITGNGENAYHVVLASGNTGVTVDGFTIRGGNANGSSSITVNTNSIIRYYGGGIYTEKGTNTLTNNTLSGNSAGYGGGIFAYNGMNTLTNNTLSGNLAGYGGGISAYNGTNTLTNNTLSGNSSTYGGGIFTGNGTNTLTNNILSGNSAIFGGGISTYIGTNTLTNNTLSGNSAYYGGGISTEHGTNTLTNNTLSGNSATLSGGIYTTNGTNTLTNNIFWDNKKGTNANTQGADYFADGTNGNTFTNNLLQLAASNYTTAGTGNYDLGTGASGNIFAQNPLFVNAADIDGADNIHRTADDGLRLKAGSPCMNTGDNTALPSSGGAGGGFDITGAARIQNATVDMGAYEGGVCPTVSTLYVDANIATSGNGTTFAQAYKTLDEALAVAHCCANIDTIKVATGTYKPTKKPYSDCNTEVTLDHLGNPLTARDYTFHLPDGLVLLGGYNAATGLRTLPSSGGAGGGAILSGDFNGDDVVTGSGSTLSITNNTENAYHVVLASAPTSGGIGVTIDGFTITGGNANDPAFTTITVNGNTIYHYFGGGIYTNHGTNTLTNNILSGNSAGGHGGGIYAINNTNTLSNNTLSGNSASYGGGIFTENGTNTLTNNTLSGNSASNSGGGIYADGTNTMTNNILSGNSAGDYGGGIELSAGIFTLNNNTLLGNSANNGGGIDIYNSSITITNNTLSGNSAIYDGGGIFSEGGTNTLTNNILSGNLATYDGGGIYTYSGTNILTNNTLSGNSASTGVGGGIVTINGTNTIKNCILWANTQVSSSTVAGADIYNSGGINTVTYCLTQQNSIYSTGTGIINNQNPLFVNAADIDGADNIHRTADDGLRLLIGSPCMNTGTVTGAPANDIIGTLRPQGAGIDMGAYENGSCPGVVTLYVDANIAVSGDGTTFAQAFKTLDEALAVAHNCLAVTRINVAEGTYKPTKKPYNTNGTNMTTTDARDLTFHIRDGLGIYGGYDAATGLRTLSFSGGAGGGSILSGDLNGDDVITGSGSTLSITGNTENAYHVVLASANATTGIGVTIDGFIITGGNASATTTITVNGNTINRNYGGGIYTYSGTNTLTNNTIYYNTVNLRGGGIYSNNATNTIKTNTVYNNKSVANGGGFFIENGVNTISNNVLYLNSANSATNGGGGIYMLNSINTLVNNTFYDNSVTGRGGGVYTANGTNTFINNIFWGNKKGINVNILGADYFAANTNGNTFKNNLLQLSASNYTTVGTGNYDLGTGASGNIFAQDPLFVNAADIDGADNIHRTADDGLRLNTCSPAIDAAINTGAPTNDILNNSIYNSLKDMGAYERQTEACPVYASTTACETVTLNNVSGNRWFYFNNTNGRIAAINPNGENLGTVTVEINDAANAVVFNNNQFLGRTLNVTSSAYPTGTTIPTAYTMRIYYYDTELTEYNTATSSTFDLTDFGMAWKEGGTGCSLATYGGSANGLIAKADISEADYGTPSSGGIGGGAGFYLSFNLNHFTIFAATTANGSPLPVKLLSFEGYKDKNLHHLDWTTATEQNVSHFEIETAYPDPSQAGQANGATLVWKTIGTVRAAGNSNTAEHYAFDNRNTTIGINYYRLKMVDFDGHFDYSTIVTIRENDEEVPTKCYPNPTESLLYIDTPDRTQAVTVIDEIGSVLQMHPTTPNTIDLSAYSKGVYFVNIGNKHFKIVKL